MKLFKQYLKESLIVENNELSDLKKHLHDQQMKYAAAQKRKDKKAMEFWNHAIKNTEEEIKYYENENFSSTQTSDSNKTVAVDQFKKSTNDKFNPDDYTDHKKAKELFDSIKDASEWLLKNSDKMGDQIAWRVFKERQAATKDLEKLKKTANGPKEFKGMKNHKAFENYAKQNGFESERRGHREGPSEDDMFDTIMYVDKNGDHVGYWQNDPKESFGVLFNTPEEFKKHEQEEYEKQQKWIDDEIKAGRDPYRD